MFSRPATHDQFLSDLAGEKLLAGRRTRLLVGDRRT